MSIILINNRVDMLNSCLFLNRVFITLKGQIYKPLEEKGYTLKTEYKLIQ